MKWLWGAFIVYVTVTATLSARADDIIAEATVSLASGYEGQAHDYPVYKFALGYKNYYMFIGDEALDMRFLGQTMGNSHLKTYGVGVTETWGDWSVFLEGGWGVLDYTPFDHVVDEVSYTYMIQRHAKEGRAIPFEQCYNGADCNRGYTNTYEDSILARIGVQYEVVEHLKVTAGWRWMQSEHYIAAWDITRHEEGRGWWEERMSQNFSAFEIGVTLSW